MSASASSIRSSRYRHLPRCDGRHAVIGDDQQVEAVVEAARGDAGDQARDRGIDAAHRRGGLRRVRTIVMRGLVDVLEVQRHERRSPRGGPVEPAEHGVDALLGRHVRVERGPVVRIGPVHRRFGPRPVHRRGAPPGPLHARPDRFGLLPPARILHRGAIGGREALPGQIRIGHRVVDDAVAIGPQAGDQRVVVRKRQRRKRGPHRRRVRALDQQAVQRRRQAAAQIGRTERIERDQDHRSGRHGFAAAGRGAAAEQRGQQRQQHAATEDSRAAAAHAQAHRCAPAARSAGRPVNGAKPSARRAASRSAATAASSK